MSMERNDTDVLFEYLRKILFERNTPMLSAQEVSPESEKLVNGMNLFHDWLEENFRFANDIAEGNLNGTEPSKDNPLCAPLKMLRSNLSHLMWQTKQVADGDYSQRVAMLGEFSTAFNTMTMQLKQREAALKEHNALLSHITDNIGEYVAVLDEETRESLYENKALVDMSIEEPRLAEDLRYSISRYDMESSGRSWEISLLSSEEEGRTLYYHVDSFYIDWQGKKAIAHLLCDVTEQKEWESSIEYAANSDALTGLFNRRYCMEMMERYIENKRDFLVCFVDLDKLKYVNDTFGHCHGEEYILTMAAVLKENVRKDDIICRIGGDEFVILMPKCTEKHSKMRMNQARNRLLQLTAEKNLKYPMSLSYGVIACGENNTLSAEEILDESDKEMYLFKQAHRSEWKV